jgi:hypothetical protein
MGRWRDVVLVAVGCGAGATAHWVVGNLRVSWERSSSPAVRPTGAAPRVDVAAASSIDVAAAVPAEPVAAVVTSPRYRIAGPAPRLELSGCPLEFVRGDDGAFTEAGRFLARERVLRPGRVKVVVIEEYYCAPCKRVIAQLSREDLGAGVDFVVLGIGEQYGNHTGALEALSGGRGWLYIGGFDEQKLFTRVFGPDSVATPSVLVVGRDGEILHGAQGLPAADTVTWVRTQLAALGISGTSDQPLASLDPRRDDDLMCHAVAVVKKKPIDRGGGPGSATTAEKTTTDAPSFVDQLKSMLAGKLDPKPKPKSTASPPAKRTTGTKKDGKRRPTGKSH